MNEIKETVHRVFTRHHIWITFCSVCFLAIIAGVVLYGDYRQAQIKKELVTQSEKVSSTTIAFSAAIKGLQEQITGIVAQNNLLNSTVQSQISQTSDLLYQVSQVNDTAESLNKLSKIDPQLLQKYSKCIF